jgi:conjugal transfer/type IV secretion protein DotA/TraY
MSANEDEKKDPSPEAVELYWKYGISKGYQQEDAKYDFINEAAIAYIDALSKKYDEVIENLQKNNDAPRERDKDLAAAESLGWLAAGAYYNTLANRNAKNLSTALPVLEWKYNDKLTNGFKQWRVNYNAAGQLIQAAKGEPVGSSEASNVLMGPMSSALGDIQKTTENNFTSESENPLVVFQTTGHVFLWIAQILFLTILVGTLVLGIIGNFNIFVLGTGIDNPFGPALNTIMILLVPAIYALLGYMVMLGGLMAVYTPLIPYIMFTFGVIGWFVSVAEAMVAGPLVSLGIISPSGHHELLGKAEPALMLLFNIFLRPSLMIFGLAVAMLLAVVIIKMINLLFWPVVSISVTGTSRMAGGPLMLLMLLGAYVMLVLAALNKCFAVINEIPQKVMRWIGGQGEGVEAPMGEIKGGVEAVSGGAKGAMGGQQQGLGTRGQYGKAREERKESKEKGEDATVSGDPSKPDGKS